MQIRYYLPSKIKYYLFRKPPHAYFFIGGIENPETFFYKTPQVTLSLIFVGTRKHASNYVIEDY